MNIIEQTKEHVNSTFTDIMTIDAFDRKGEWFIEVLFKGGRIDIIPATQDEITQIEHDLDERGWQIDQSLFHSGFNVKPANGLGRWWEMRGDAAAIAELDNEPLAFDDEELIFASGIEWPEAEYGLEPAL